jgi:hypothetical protein
MVAMRRGVISLNHLHCIKDGEIGPAEPYLLTAFFKIDGDSNFISLIRREGDPPVEGFIDGPCTFQGTPGTHGNLGDTSVSDGDDVPIPPAVGEFGFALEPITGAALRPPRPEIGIGGFVGVIVALMEENSLADSAAAAGHAAFNRTLERKINDLLPKLRQGTHPRPTPAEIEQLKDEVTHRITAAVIGTEGDFFRLLNPDISIGADAYYTGKSSDVYARFQRIITVHPQPGPGNFPPGPDQQIVTHDYELFGSIVVDIPLQITGVTADGGVWHAIRDPNGSWIGFGDVKTQTGPDRGAFTSVSCAGIGEDLHVCGTTSDGKIWHAIREPGGWIGFGDVKTQTGPDRGAFIATGCGHA